MFGLSLKLIRLNAPGRGEEIPFPTCLNWSHNISDKLKISRLFTGPGTSIKKLI